EELMVRQVLADHIYIDRFYNLCYSVRIMVTTVEGSRPPMSRLMREAVQVSAREAFGLTENNYLALFVQTLRPNYQDPIVTERMRFMVTGSQNELSAQLDHPIPSLKNLE